MLLEASLNNELLREKTLSLINGKDIYFPLDIFPNFNSVLGSSSEMINILSQYHVLFMHFLDE